MKIGQTYQAVFHSGKGDGYRQAAEIRCIENNLRLEDDDLIYNAYGIAVARYLGPDLYGNLRFENLRLEREWDKAKVLTGDKSDGQERKYREDGTAERIRPS